MACIREKCRDPCPGSCGLNAHCQVLNHIPMCICPEGYSGDPFMSCYIKPEREYQKIDKFTIIYSHKLLYIYIFHK